MPKSKALAHVEPAGGVVVTSGEDEKEIFRYIYAMSPGVMCSLQLRTNCVTPHISVYSFVLFIHVKNHHFRMVCHLWAK